MQTEYVILCEIQPPDGWALHPQTTLLAVAGRQAANGGEQAIRRFRVANPPANGDHPESGWHAIPVKNWTAYTSEIEQPPPRLTYREAPVPVGDGVPGLVRDSIMADRTEDPNA